MRHGTRQLSGERARHGAWHTANGLILRRHMAGFCSAVYSAAGNPAKLPIVAFGGAAVHWKAALPTSLRKLIETANALVKADRA